MKTILPQSNQSSHDPESVLHEPLATLRQALAPLGGDEGHDDVATRLNALECACREVTELRRIWMESFAEWLGLHGDLQMGPVRWHLSIERVWKCRDPGGALDLLLQVIGGDVKGLAEFLAADAIRPGATRAVLPPEDFESLFMKVERPKATPGKPRPIRDDLRFSRPRDGRRRSSEAVPPAGEPGVTSEGQGDGEDIHDRTR